MRVQIHIVIIMYIENIRYVNIRCHMSVDEFFYRIITEKKWSILWSCFEHAIYNNNKYPILRVDEYGRLWLITFLLFLFVSQWFFLTLSVNPFFMYNEGLKDFHTRHFPLACRIYSVLGLARFAHFSINLLGYTGQLRETSKTYVVHPFL